MEYDVPHKMHIATTEAVKMVDILTFMADKNEVKTEMIITSFGYSETTTKRYLRQLTELGHLEAKGGNKNRVYRRK